MAVTYIVGVFYAQILCAPASFRILEIWWKQEASGCFLLRHTSDARSANALESQAKADLEAETLQEVDDSSASGRPYPISWLLSLDEVHGTTEKHPMSPLSALLSLALFYLLTLVFVVFLSESIGILIRFSAETKFTVGLAHMIPSLSLAIPLAVRMLAQFEYPHAKHFALVIPLMMIVSIFYSALQVASQEALPFLVELWSVPLVRQEFIRTSVLVSFVPVFIEAIFWMLQIFSKQENDL